MISEEKIDKMLEEADELNEFLRHLPKHYKLLHDMYIEALKEKKNKE